MTTITSNVCDSCFWLCLSPPFCSDHISVHFQEDTVFHGQSPSAHLNPFSGLNWNQYARKPAKLCFWWFVTMMAGVLKLLDLSCNAAHFDSVCNIQIQRYPCFKKKEKVATPWNVSRVLNLASHVMLWWRTGTQNITISNDGCDSFFPLLQDLFTPRGNGTWQQRTL